MSGPTRLIQGIFALGMAQVLTWVGGLALAILLPRYLGDVNLGKLAFALALAQLAGLITHLGTATYLTKEVARAPERAASLTLNALVARIPLSLAAGAVVVVVVQLSGGDSLTAHVVYILAAGILLTAVGSVVVGTLQGLQRMKAVAVYTVVTNLTYAALSSAALLAGAGPVEVALASVGSAGLALALAGVALGRATRLAAPLALSTMRSVVVGGLPFFVWQAALKTYGRIDFVLLSFLAHDAVVGWYSAAYRLIGIPGFLPTIVCTAMLPALSAAAKDARAFGILARRSLDAIVLTTLPMVLGMTLLADKIVQLFDYPAGFANSVVPMVLLAPAILFAGVDMVIGTVLTATDRQRQWALTGVAAAVLNPAVNLVVIPYTQTVFGNGAIGAAIVTTFTEVFMMAVGIRLLPPGVFDGRTIRHVLKCAAAGAIMGVAVWATRDLPLPVPILLGAVVYGGGCLALGATSIAELKEARIHLLRRQPPAGVAA